MNRLAFGLNEAIPEDARAAWGARLIVHADGYVDFMPDRQDAWGVDDETKRDFLDRLGAACPLGLLRQLVGERLVSREIDTRAYGQVVIFDDLGVKVVGDAKASAGYLYVAAFRTDAELDEDTKL